MFFFFFLSRKQHGSVCSVDGGQEETRMWGKFWLDRLREQRAHLFWTLVDGQPKEEEVGRAWKPGHVSVKRLWSCKDVCLGVLQVSIALWLSA